MGYPFEKVDLDRHVVDVEFKTIGKDALVKIKMKKSVQSDGVQFVVDITEGSMELTSPRKADAIEGGCTYHYMGPDVTFCCDHKRTILSDTVPVFEFTWKDFKNGNLRVAGSPYYSQVTWSEIKAPEERSEL